MIKKFLKFFVFLLVSFAVPFSLSYSAEKVLKVAYDADPVSMDPHEQLSGATLQMSHLLFDPLVRWDKNHNLEARLATKWERIDNKTMRFYLKKGVKFHSGNKLSADDVIWTFKRLKESADFKGIFTEIIEIKKLDDLTIDIITEDNYPLVLENATYIFPMDSKFYSGKTKDGKDKSEIVKHKGSSFASENVSGSGPFYLGEREKGVKTEFIRFKDYWDKSSPGNIDRVVLTPIAEETTRVAALLAGDVDFIAPISPTDMPRVKKSKKAKLITMSGNRIIMFQLNQNKVEAFKDKRVRQAFVYAVNNAGIVDKIMDGFATTAAQMSPKGFLGYNDSLKPRYNLAKARELMKEAGYEKGFSLKLMAPNNRYVNDEKIAQAVVAMLSKINIKAELKTLPKAQYWPAYDEREGGMMMIGWESDTQDSANFSEFLTMTYNKETGKGQYNAGSYSNAAVDYLTIKSLSEVDNEKRKQILQGVETILNEDAAIIPLHWQNLSWGALNNIMVEDVVNSNNQPYLGDAVIK